MLSTALLKESFIPHLVSWFSIQGEILYLLLEKVIRLRPLKVLSQEMICNLPGTNISYYPCSHTLF